MINPGAEMNLIGGVGFSILHSSDEVEPLSGPLQSMGLAMLPKVDVVMTIEESNTKSVARLNRIEKK